MRIVREVASDSARVLFPTGRKPKTGTWKGLANFRQIHRCLESGEILSDPKQDEHRSWRFEMSYFCAGDDVHVDVALYKNSEGLYEVAIVEYWME